MSKDCPDSAPNEPPSDTHDSVAVFLGAGFSKWAADLPLASQLFDFDIETWGPREEKFLDEVSRLRETWNLSHPDGLAEQFIADALHSDEHASSLVQWYIVRRLSEPFIWKECYGGIPRRHSLMIDESRKIRLPGVQYAQEFLQHFYHPSLTGIVTTNYDMLVEYALGTRRFNYGTPNEELKGRRTYPIAPPVVLNGSVPLAKVHGSVSWDAYQKYTEGRGGITGHALIVPPTHDKKLPRSLLDAWHLAEDILHNSTRMIVFGFAFNSYDQDILTLLRSSGASLEAVLLVNQPPSAESQLNAAHNLWPGAKAFFTAPPPDWTADAVVWGPYL